MALSSKKFVCFNQSAVRLSDPGSKTPPSFDPRYWQNLLLDSNRK